MADPPNENIFTGLMDEYYAECDEHISAIKRGLLALEVSYSQQVFDELFRAFHTIKGLSGMVAFRDAEQLAHKVESYLRAITLTSGGLLRSGIETLRASTNTLEQVISAHRLGRPVPDTSTLIKRIECLIPDESDSRATIPARAKVSAEGLSPEKLDQIAAAEKKGLGIWSFHFSPGPELIQRGVNINAVRARLKEAGELIHAVPKIVDKEKVVFEFILASSEEPGVFGSWEKDGIRFQPFVPMKDAELPSEAPIPTLTPPSMVRVDLSRLDDLMQRMGEVVIRKAHFSETLKGVEQELPTGTWRALIDAFSSMERGLRDLREGLMRIRMVPIADLFERMRFAISDLGALQKKRIRLEFFGQETEIDKFVVERMIDAMLHLVRNAVSHGIEDPEERASLGKPPEGRITLAASSTSEKVVLEITDDGRGIDLEVITNKAMSLGLIKPEDRLKSDRLLDIICETGFTTHLHADVASGRGIGMTVVRKAVEELGGSLELDTSPGKGSRFSMVLPLSLSIRKV
ncbi:MAG: ATP-binding protein, partial [Syntrophobacteraceae bacterium]